MEKDEILHTLILAHASLLAAIRALLNGYDSDWARDEALTEKNAMSPTDYAVYNHLCNARDNLRDGITTCVNEFLERPAR